jgi:Uri superfamily endonuclease
MFPDAVTARGKKHLEVFMPDFHTDLECEMASAIQDLSEWWVTAFGASDRACASHLFWSPEDPLSSPQFHSFLQYFRMERIFDRYGESGNSSPS